MLGQSCDRRHPIRELAMWPSPGTAGGAEQAARVIDSGWAPRVDALFVLARSGVRRPPSVQTEPRAQVFDTATRRGYVRTFAFASAGRPSIMIRNMIRQRPRSLRRSVAGLIGPRIRRPTWPVFECSAPIHVNLPYARKRVDFHFVAEGSIGAIAAGPSRRPASRASHSEAGPRRPSGYLAAGLLDGARAFDRPVDARATSLGCSKASEVRRLAAVDRFGAGHDSHQRRARPSRPDHFDDLRGPDVADDLLDRLAVVLGRVWTPRRDRRRHVRSYTFTEVRTSAVHPVSSTRRRGRVRTLPTARSTSRGKLGDALVHLAKERGDCPPADRRC